jgi:hypothetical protein
MLLAASYCRNSPVDLRAARANRDFCTDEKRIRTEITVIVRNKNRMGSQSRSSIAHGCAFDPCAIGDPCGRLFVRATSQLRNGARFESPGAGQNNIGHAL